MLSEAAVVDMFTVQRNTSGLITKAFATQNARALEQLHAMKLASRFTTELAVGTWPKSLGYGLGCWLAVDGTRANHTIRSMFNTHVTIWDWETGRPHFAIGMAFSKFDGGWEMANTVFYREVKGIGDPPPPPPPPLRAKVGRSKG